MNKMASVPGTRDELPKEAFAIVGDSADPETWKLPHHKKNIVKALRGKLDIEETVDWKLMSLAVVALSRRSRSEERVDAAPHQILQAAQHLAVHYREAWEPLPDILAALV